MEGSKDWEKVRRAEKPQLRLCARASHVIISPLWIGGRPDWRPAAQSGCCCCCCSAGWSPSEGHTEPLAAAGAGLRRVPSNSLPGAAGPPTRGSEPPREGERSERPAGASLEDSKHTVTTSHSSTQLIYTHPPGSCDWAWPEGGKVLRTVRLPSPRDGVGVAYMTVCPPGYIMWPATVDEEEDEEEETMEAGRLAAEREGRASQKRGSLEIEPVNWWNHWDPHRWLRP